MQNLLKRTITGVVFGILFWAIFIYLPPLCSSFLLLFILLQIVFFEIKNLFDLKQPLYWFILPFYPILPFVLMISMNHYEPYQKLLFLLFIIVFSYDSGSYIIGKSLGKHHIAPWLSPAKTWEGSLGGYIFACIGLTWLLWELKSTQSWAFVLSFCFIVCTLSLAGDLFESWLKRRAHIKDSGKILPGHGGFLDRFDGILFAVFFFYSFKDQLVALFKF